MQGRTSKERGWYPGEDANWGLQSEREIGPSIYASPFEKNQSNIKINEYVRFTQVDPGAFTQLRINQIKLVKLNMLWFFVFFLRININRRCHLQCLYKWIRVE